ncbi:tetratricopeptide repeat protein [Methylibium sp.]|uniref:tetratricopeptide repeat protein n=1 Tax=Methylibium sp. TaxID=2067992 RepID=UPI003D0DCE3C
MAAFRLAALAFAAGSVLAVSALAQPAPVAASASAPDASASVENSALDAPLFYQLLIGEMELGQGDAGTSYQVLLDAARKTRDERLFRRATEVALQAQAGEQALEAARAWRQAVPGSIDAHRFEVQLLVALNRTAETATPLRATLALVPAAQRPAAIASLPGYFSRTADRKATTAVLEQVLLPYAEQRTAGESPATAVAAWVALGRSRLAAGESARALDAARRGQALGPQSEAVALLAIELMPSEAQAEALVTTFLAAQPPASAATRSAVRLVYARTLALGQRYVDAAPQLEAVTRDAPQFIDAWLTLGALRLELKQPAEAEAALREYLARVESATDAAANEPADAQDEDAATPTQRLTQAYLLLAQAAEQRRDFKGAEAWLAKVDSSQALAVQSRRASLLAQQGKLGEARSLIRKLPERQPEDARAKLLVEAQLLRDQKQWSEALGVLAEANDRYRDDTDLLYEQAMIAEKLDRMAEMEQLLRRVIALKPQQPQAYNALGYSLADRNQRLPEARQLIAKAIELSPGDPFLIDSLGWVEYRLGHHDEALRWLRQAHSARPDTEIAAHLGEVLWVSGRRDEARRVLAEARARDAANDVLKETLARLKVDL